WSGCDSEGGWGVGGGGLFECGGQCWELPVALDPSELLLGGEHAGGCPPQSQTPRPPNTGPTTRRASNRSIKHAPGCDASLTGTATTTTTPRLRTCTPPTSTPAPPTRSSTPANRSSTTPTKQTPTASGTEDVPLVVEVAAGGGPGCYAASSL
ncbi:MAG: hypothetical protein GY742_22930, partial [Hyphomicrobiales bacterium]|nr:hypothetical protein [Hyphomicrobiales bacterium]